MASIEELRAARLSKLVLLKEKGITIYPAHVERTHRIADVITDFDMLSSKGGAIRIAGRIMSIRGQGKILFVDLDDGSGRFQIVLKTDTNPTYTDKDIAVENAMELFADAMDIGDFIEVGGALFITKSEQQSIDVSDWRVLTKSLLPIPDEHFGLKDDDERYRKRYLDILMNKDQKEMFLKKAHFWKVIRYFLEEKGFVAVDTPTLETIASGAEAEPFATHHNDFDLDVYLRISIGELWQKKLMAAGFPKTYEIGRAYRNEGTSPNHLQEFTNVEFYWAYADYRDGMSLVKEMYRRVAEEVFQTTKFEARGHTFDLADEWIEIDYVEEIKKQTGINILNTEEKAIRKFLDKNNVVTEAETFERLVDTLWKYCRKNISGPAFVIGYPDFIQPLAKRSNADEKIVEQFQVLLGGAEIGKGYSELNDPIDQRARFEHQQKLRDAGDKEAMMPDYDFLEMLEYGMPPTCGFGAGERLFSFLVDKPIRETTLFPLMRPKNEDRSSSTTITEQEEVIDQDFSKRMVLIVREDLEGWQICNTVGHLSAFLGNKVEGLTTGSCFIAEDGEMFVRNSQYPIVIKKAKSNADLRKVYKKVKKENVQHLAFTREMIDEKGDEAVQKKMGQKQGENIELLGVGVFAENEVANKITKKFSLWDKK